ncbi:MAG: S4 domain-containing protein, partial [Ramlibacter sp.]
MAEPVRLAKRVAAMLPCSRREAEQYIEGGFVRVDGQVVDQPQARVADAQVV